MPLEINITSLKSREIIAILTNYPQGHLQVNQDHIFWISDYLEPENLSAPSGDGRFYNPNKPRPTQGQQLAKTFKKMSDTLGSMVC